jgi:nucleotide-binding universal stress UspA family protein
MPDTSLGRWTRPSTILVATDLSDLDHLMPFAFEQAIETGARLILLHVLASETRISVDTAGMVYYDPVNALGLATKALDPWCEMARNKHVACDALVREGCIAQHIADAMRQFQADRLLLGTRNRSRLGKLFLGSVAEQVLRSVNLPVMTVGPEAHLPVESASHERVMLYATTLRESSRPNVALACGIATARHAKLVLLHVLPPMDKLEHGSLPSELDAAARYELNSLATTSSGIAVEPCIVHGNPSIEILAEASAHHANLIVLGAAPRPAFENLTRDHTVFRILAHSRCPVLTLNQPLACLAEPQIKQIEWLRSE